MSLVIPKVDVSFKQRIFAKEPVFVKSEEGVDEEYGVEFRYFDDALYICKVRRSTGELEGGARLVLDDLPE
tara:strand:+ start:600 stop:812 length:213 start_codon:yes stop_codon:yes gene_type:complete